MLSDAFRRVGDSAVSQSAAGFGSCNPGFFKSIYYPILSDSLFTTFFGSVYNIFLEE